MVKLIIGNVETTIVGQLAPDMSLERQYHKALHTDLSYEVKGVEWSPAYKEGHWDGRISLYKRNYKTGGGGHPTFPTGLIGRVIHLFQQLDVPFKCIDRRAKPEKNLDLVTIFDQYGREMRQYQDLFVDKMVGAGRGVGELATGGGKTLCAVKMLVDIGVGPFLFFVPSLSLLKQTHREFQKYLRHADGSEPHIGIMGDGVCDINPTGINVITVQTGLAAFDEKYQERGDKIVKDENAWEKSRKSLDELESTYEETEDALNRAETEASKKHALLNEGATGERTKKYISAVAKDTRLARTAYSKAKVAYEARVQSINNKAAIRRLVKRCGGFIFDEAHVAAIIIQTLGEHAENAYYRYGISATPWREDNQEIRIEATMGRKLISISASDLIDMGFLVPIDIYMIRIRHIEEADGYHDAYRKHITDCWERNYRIKQCAEAFKEMGMPVLILVDHIEHGQNLEGMVRDSLFVAGGDRGEDDPDDEERDYRRRFLNDIEANKIVGIATKWANVGIDAPRLVVVILAGSIKSTTTTYQQVGRITRLSPGKHRGIVIDFYDEEKNMREHSVRRKKVYSLERRFRLKIIS